MTSFTRTFAGSLGSETSQGAAAMAKRHNEGKEARYFAMHHFMLKTDAWRALSAGARAVHVQLGLRYSGFNNGKIACSVRDAATECNLAIDTASRAFKELIDLGFIEETRHGGLSRKTRIASEWRLTAFKCDLTGALKSTLFLQRGAHARASPGSQPAATKPSATPSAAACPQCGKQFTPWRARKGTALSPAGRRPRTPGQRRLGRMRLS